MADGLPRTLGEDQDDSASIASVCSGAGLQNGGEGSVTFASFYEAHRALAACYEADIGRLEAEKVQSTSFRRSISQFSQMSGQGSRQVSEAAVQRHLGFSAGMVGEGQKLRRRSSGSNHEAVALSMGLASVDFFQQEDEITRSICQRRRHVLEGADARQLARHAIERADKEGQEIEDCHQPRFIWQQSDDEAPPLQRRTSTAFRVASIPEHLETGRIGMAPDRGFRVYWDCFLMLALLAETVLLPLQALAEDPDFEQEMLTFQLVPVIYWSLDMIFSFATGFYSTGQLVGDLWLIAKNYASSWLLFDVTYVVVDVILVLLASHEAKYWPRELSSITALRFLQMALRVVRISRVGKMAESLKQEFISDVSLAKANIVQIGIQILLIHHIMACGWYYLGTMQDGWVTTAAKSDRSRFYLYTTSLHWMFCQLGFGGTEIEPNNTAERIYGLLVNFMALVIFSTLLGTVTSLAALLNRSSEERRFLFANLGRFLQYNQIDRELSYRITHFLRHAYAVKQLHIHEDQVQLFELLSVPLCREMQLARYKNSLQELGFLCMPDLRMTGTEHLIQRLASKAVMQKKFAAFDLVWEAETAANQAFFLMEGSLQYELQSVEVSVTKTSWMAEMCLWTPWMYMGSLSTKDPSGLVMVHVRQFYDCIRDCFQTGFAREYAREYLLAMNNLKAVTDLWQRPVELQHLQPSTSIFGYTLATPATSVFERLRSAARKRVSRWADFSRVVPGQ